MIISNWNESLQFIAAIISKLPFYGSDQIVSTVINLIDHD